MIERAIDKNTKLYEFSDIIDFTEYAEAIPSNYYARKSKEDAWAGGTFKDALTQARTGNPELVKQLFDGVNVIEAMIDEEKVGEIRDVTGEYFDVADYLSGEPEVFRREEYGERKPVVPVYASFAMQSGISNITIRNRGCAIVALCDELSRSGFIVDLNLVQASSYEGRKYFTKIHVGIDPLDLDTVAFIVANPLCQRRLWLAAFERYTDDRYPWGHGTPIEYDLAEIFDTGLSGFYFVSGTHTLFKRSNFDTLESAKNHVLKMVEQFKEKAEQVILG
jgi:DNA-binding protein